MPVYLFTFHAYKSWLPDRDEGYFRQNKGHFANDPEMANQYARNAKHDGIVFDRQIQRIIIEELVAACGFQGHRLHAVATDQTHVHVLLSWKSDDSPIDVRARIKTSQSKRLRRELSHGDSNKYVGPMFSRHGAHSRIRDQAHFEHLVRTYCPSHAGEKWFEDDGN